MRSWKKDFQLSAGVPAAGFDKKLRDKVAGKLSLPVKELGRVRISGRSTDSRGREPVLVCKVIAEVPDECPLPEYERKAEYIPEFPENSTLKNPVVVGIGPAGIFCALGLAMAGCEPLIIDRGPDVEQRCRGVESFLKTRELDENCNLLIGEGGAGTFSAWD